MEQEQQPEQKEVKVKQVHNLDGWMNNENVALCSEKFNKFKFEKEEKNKLPFKFDFPCYNIVQLKPFQQFVKMLKNLKEDSIHLSKEENNNFLKLVYDGDLTKASMELPLIEGSFGCNAKVKLSVDYLSNFFGSFKDSELSHVNNIEISFNTDTPVYLSFAKFEAATVVDKWILIAPKVD